MVQTPLIYTLFRLTCVRQIHANYGLLLIACLLVGCPCRLWAGSWSLQKMVIMGGWVTVLLFQGLASSSQLPDACLNIFVGNISITQPKVLKKNVNEAFSRSKSGQ